MTKQKFNPQSGKSLLELVVILVITAVLVTFAIAQFGGSKTNLNRQNLVREFKVSLERARFDSVKRRAQGSLSRIVIESATRFTVLTDLNQNGTLETSESRSVNFGSSGVKFVGTLIYPITISFDRHGHISATNSVVGSDGEFQQINPTFTICDRGCTSLETANVKNSNVISISPSGTVAMLGGGESQPSFSSPTVSNSVADDVPNPWLNTESSASNTTAEPTPVATPTPTSTPTPTTPTPTPTTPTPTPTTATPTPTPATPTPTPVPQASPTPRACTNNERPSQTGCQCRLPMTVRSNGQCKN